MTGSACRTTFIILIALNCFSTHIPPKNTLIKHNIQYLKNNEQKQGTKQYVHTYKNMLQFHKINKIEQKIYILWKNLSTVDVHFPGNIFKIN